MSAGYFICVNGYVDCAGCVNVDCDSFSFTIGDVLRNYYYTDSCLIDCEVVFGTLSREELVVSFEVYCHIVVACLEIVYSQVAFAFIDECGIVFVIDFDFDKSGDVVRSFECYEFTLADRNV